MYWTWRLLFGVWSSAKIIKYSWKTKRHCTTAYRSSQETKH